MALVREFLARALVALALATAAAALGCFWSSLLVIRTAGTLNTLEQSSVAHQVSAELNHLAPGVANAPKAEAAITTALHNPAVTQGLATSVPGGSSLLSAELARLDSGLAPALKGNHLSINVGQHALASLARRLHSLAKAALIVALIETAIALMVSPMRHIVLRHLAFGAGLVGGLAILLSWAVPALVGHFTHGGLHTFAGSILSGAFPVRSVLLELAIGGAAVYIATHVFELVGGNKKFRTSGPTTPLPSGNVV